MRQVTQKGEIGHGLNGWVVHGVNRAERSFQSLFSPHQESEIAKTHSRRSTGR